jgi:hypothetical protein
MKRYTLTYRDRLNNQHVAYIDIVSGSGSATIENGDVSPLVIEEDYNDDMLSPIRTKTGYLRVVEPIFGQYADLYPTSPTSHIVRTTDGFVGYLQPQSFSDDWDAGPRILKLPVSSPLALMQTTKFTSVGYNIKYRLLDMLRECLQIMGYEKIVVPRGGTQVDGFIFSFVSSLTICPFAEEDDYQFPVSGTIYAPKNVSQVLEAICNYYGMMVHDCNNGSAQMSDSLLVITKNDYDGPYQLWTDEDLDQETPPASMAVTGATVRNFSSYFEVAADNNNESFVQPFSKITFNSEGEQSYEVAVRAEWSHYTDRDIYANHYYHCMLQPVGDWLTAEKLSVTSLSNAVALCGIYKQNEEQEGDAKEYILTSMPAGTPQDYEMFRVKMIGSTPHSYRVSGVVKVFSPTQDDYVFPSANMGNFGLALKYGAYYWDWSEDENGWVTNPQEKILYVTPSDTDGTFVTPPADLPTDDLQASCYEVIIYFDPANDLYNYTKIFGDITLQAYKNKATRKYVTVDPNKPTVVEGNSGSMDEADVDLLFSRNFNSNYLTEVGGSFQHINSEYLLHPQKIRKVTVVRNGVFDYTNYLCKWSFGDAFTWRIIAVSEDIANCERTLTFMGSTHI